MGVVLVSRMRLLRETLRSNLIASGYGGPVEATDIDGLPRRSAPWAPSVLFVSSGAADGVKAVNAFRCVHPGTSVGVLALTDRDEEFLAWASAGISGYLEPDTSLDGIVSAIARLADGKVVYPERLSRLLLQFARRPTHIGPAALAELTQRELEVIELLADGHANKQIARRLTISDATVKNHVHSILEKLRVRSRGQAAAYFRRSSPSLASG